MTFYPKLPTGPSSLGAAQVRALQARGGDWQFSQRDANTTAYVKGEFSRIVVGGVEYVATGRVGPDPGTLAARGLQRYQVPGQGIVGYPITNGFPRDEFIGAGRYITYFRDEQSMSAPTVFTYPRGGSTENISLRRSIVEYGVQIRNLYNTVRFLGPTTSSLWEAHRGFITGGYRPVVTYAGADHYITAGLIDGSRSDVAGRQLQNPIIFHWSREESFGVPINPTFARSDVEFSDRIPVTVLQGGAVALLAEVFSWTEGIDEGKDYRPKLWALWMPKPEMNATAAFDLTSVLFQDSRLPSPMVGSPDYYAFEAAYGYNFNVETTMWHMTTVALPDNRMLAFYWVDSNDSDSFSRLRIARITVGTGGALTSELLYNEIVERDPVSNPSVQHAVHLGEGTVLAKRLSGYSNTNRRVTFMLSTDFGTTWTDLAPVGFDNNGRNECFGDFTVHAPRTEERDGLVLITAWDDTAKGYYVYSSSNFGASWKRQGKLSGSSVFRRIDQTVHRVDIGPPYPWTEGGNFTQLLPGSNPTRLVDPTIPGRYSI